MWGLLSQLKAYVEEWFTGSRITIVGVGELFAFSVPRNLSTNLLLLAVEIIEGLLAVQFVYTVNDQKLNGGKARKQLQLRMSCKHDKLVWWELISSWTWGWNLFPSCGDYLFLLPLYQV